MKPAIIVGILLDLLGIVGLSYNRITYASREKIAEIGFSQATAEKEKSILLSPILGDVGLIADVG